MSFFRGTVSLVLTLLLTPTLPADDQRQQEDRAAPIRATHLPTTWNIVVQSDGSAVAPTYDSVPGGPLHLVVYLSADDPRVWSPIPIRFDDMPKSIARWGMPGVGGDRHRVFLMVKGDGDGQRSWHLVRVEVTEKRSVVVRSLSHSVVAFASANVGALRGGRDDRDGKNLEWTNDGGNSWHEIDLLRQGLISNLQWVDESKLLIGSTDGSVRLMDFRREEHSRERWRFQAAALPIRDVVVDNAHVWVVQDGLSQPTRLKLENGRVESTPIAGARIDEDATATFAGMAACHGHVLVPAFPFAERGDYSSSLTLWGPNTDGNEYEPLKTFSTKFVGVAAVIPSKNSRCLLIARVGTAYLIDLEKREISETPLEVTLLPPLPHPTAPSAEQINRMTGLAPRVPGDRRSAIFAKANRETEWTSRQRIEWILDQFERAAEEPKESTPK